MFRYVGTILPTFWIGGAVIHLVLMVREREKSHGQDLPTDRQTDRVKTHSQHLPCKGRWTGDSWCSTPACDAWLRPLSVVMIVVVIVKEGSGMSLSCAYCRKIKITVKIKIKTTPRLEKSHGHHPSHTLHSNIWHVKIC